MENLFFVSGMPRSGSTLLQAILDQNPQFHAGVTSGLVQVIIGIRNNWDKYAEHRAIPEEINRQKKHLVINNVFSAYYGERTEAYVFDKSREWLAHIETMEWALDRKVKILVPVRDLREILASFELLHRNTSKELQTSQENADYIAMQTVASRCKVWTSENQPVGLAYNRIMDAIRRGYKDRMHFVKYDELCNNPTTTMNGIYDFLNLEPFTHDFDNIEKNHSEGDRVYGYLNLHTVKPKLIRVIHKADGILGADVAKVYGGKYVWDLHF